MKLSTLHRKAAKEANALGHNLKWGNVYGNSTTQVFSENAVCKNCCAGLSCHDNVGTIYTRGLDGQQTMKRRCQDVVEEIEKDMNVY